MTYRSDTSEGPTAGTEAVDPLACPTCRGAMRIVACLTQTSVIDQISRIAGHAPRARSAIAPFTRPTPIEIPSPSQRCKGLTS